MRKETVGAVGTGKVDGCWIEGQGCFLKDSAVCLPAFNPYAFC